MKEPIKPGYARVTEIINDHETFAKVPPDKLENARLRGERVDELCKAWILGFPAEALRPGDKNYTEAMEFDAAFFNSFKLWAVDKLADLQVASRQYCDKLLITGEPDLLWDDAGRMKIVDLKATAAASPTWELQGAIYAYLEEENGLPIDGIEFLRLKKDGKKPCVYEYEKERGLCMFMNFYHKYQYLKKYTYEVEEFYRTL